MNTYNNPAVAADLIPFRLIDGRLNVGLVNRPDYGPSLPGVYIGQHELIRDALDRAADKGGITLPDNLTVTPLGYHDQIGRDDRTRTISFPHLVTNVGGDDRTTYTPVADLGYLPFDHNSLITEAAQWITTPENVHHLFTDDNPMTAGRVKNILTDLGYPAPASLGRTLRRLYTRTGDTIRNPDGGRPGEILIKE